MKKFIILVCSALLILPSCESWLDVSPKSEVKESDIFAKESGFKTVLLGQYINMTSTSLYGGSLTMGLLDVLAQYYALSSDKSDLMPASHYDYMHENVRPVIDRIWSDSYEIIANLNNLLENMESKRELFTGSNWEIIKGEALGLRAFLHFDLLRLFAPSYVIGKNQPAIPYVNRVSSTPFAQLTVEEVARQAIRDLLEAEELLRDVDPFGPAFKKYSDTGSENASYEADGGFLTYRRERMNYYAVLGTLARIYLYIDNTDEARRYCNIAMQSGRTSPSSVVFQLFSDKTSQFSDRYFNPKLDAENQLIIPIERKNEFYETSRYGSIDSRLKEWFNYYPNSSEEYVSKYMKQQGSEPVNIPLLRGCEIYYIASECASTPDSAYMLLNRVRNSFDISTAYDLNEGSSLLDEELFKEYRKSFVAEGQLFYYMKRRNFDAIPSAPEGTYPTLYTLPLPEDEKEFGNIKD